MTHLPHLSLSVFLGKGCPLGSHRRTSSSTAAAAAFVSLEAQICPVGDVIVTIDTRRVKHTRNDCEGAAWRQRQSNWAGDEEVLPVAFRVWPQPAAAAHRGADNSNAIIATRCLGLREGEGEGLAMGLGLGLELGKVCVRPGRVSRLSSRYFVFDTMSTL